MRLTSWLLTWPKKRPNGYIWSGKNRMVQKVESWHLNKINKDIEREKKNMYLLLNPYFTPEQERIGAEARKQIQQRPDQHLFKMRKARIEATVMAPTFVEDNIKHMKNNISWE